MSSSPNPVASKGAKRKTTNKAAKTGSAGSASVVPYDANLRAAAGIYYMTDESAPTLEVMSRDARFNSVALKTLERWCKDDQWVERRSAFLQKWKDRANARIGTELCRIRQRDLADLEMLRDMAIEKLNDDLTMPKSWEGVAKILLEATEHRDRIASAIGSELMPTHGGEQPALTAQDVGVAPEELQLAAKAILQQRREALRIAAGGLSGLHASPPAPVVTPPAPVIIETEAVAVPSEPRPAVSIGVGDEEDDEEDA